LWANERRAEQSGRVIEDLWDSLNHSTNKLRTLAEFPIGGITVANYPPPRALPHEIKLFTPAANPAEWSPSQWRQFLAQRGADGWQLAQIEFRHNAFDAATPGHPAHSSFYFAAGLLNSERHERAFLEGNLRVQWEGAKVAVVDASDLKLATRGGEPPFPGSLCASLHATRPSFFIDPLLVYDFTGDGQPDVVLASANVRLRRKSGDRFETSTFCPTLASPIFTGVIGDFDGDGRADFLCATFEGCSCSPVPSTGLLRKRGGWSGRPRFI